MKSASGQKPAGAPGHDQICFTCGQIGHFSPSCPNRPGLHVLSSSPTPASSSVAVLNPTQGFSVALSFVEGEVVDALVDSGSSNSYVSEDLARKLNATFLPQMGSLTLGNASVIPRPPRCELMFSFAMMQHTHMFDILNTGYVAIIGRDLMELLHLSIAMVPPKPEEPDTALTLVTPDTSHQLESMHPARQKLLDMIGPILGNLSGFCTYPGAIFDLVLSDWTPKWRCQYPVPFRYHNIVDEQISKWLRDGVIRLATPGCGWNNPITTAPKRAPDDVGTIKSARRVCIDPAVINARVKEFAYALPVILDLIQRYAAKGYVMSLVDITSAFNALLMTQRAQDATTFEWGGVRYCFVGCPFGIKTIPSAWQALISKILAPFESFASVYIDDILIFSPDMDTHVQQVHTLLSCLTSYNLKINPSKSKFGFTRLVVLGHVIQQGRIILDTRKLQIVETFPFPMTGKQVEAFLGVMNYFRRFIHTYSRFAAPLEAVRKLRSIPQDDPTLLQSFNDLKLALRSAPILHLPVYSLPFYLATDASTRGIGGVLFQQEDNSPRRIVELLAQALSTAERNYSAHLLELTALTWCLTKVHHIVHGFKVIVLTDHASLTRALAVKRPSSHVIRHWECLMDFDLEIRHIPGVTNVLPDALSRLFLEGENVQQLHDSTPALHTLSSLSSDDVNSDPSPSSSTDTVPSVSSSVASSPSIHKDPSYEEWIREVKGKRLPAPEERTHLLASVHDTHSGEAAMFKRLFKGLNV